MPKLQDLIFSANYKDTELVNAIKEEIEINNFKHKIYDASKAKNFNKNMRKCEISWIPVGEKLLVDEVLTKIIKRVNQEENWNLKLSNWQCDIQYTHYRENHDHYDWHVDTLKGDKESDKRLISIVYCLSSKDDYDGAFLEFKNKNQCLSIKLDIGDFVVFHSHLLHRVTKLTGGERETLVGWYQ
jgi:PKHD-type hydroxylase